MSNRTHAMATTYGRLQEFQPDSDSVTSYLERVSLYFDANGIVDGKRVPILLSSIGASTYSLLSHLLAPDKPGSMSFDQICVALRNHFEPKCSIIAERFHFHKRDQTAGKTVAAFDAALRKLAVHCNLGEVLQDTLHDCFVCGLRHNAIQRRLLSETSLTYDKALEIAKAMEAADKDARAFKRTDTAVQKLGGGYFRKQKSLTPRQSCYRCGRPNHTPTECKFKDTQCRMCGKTGHIATACAPNWRKPLTRSRSTNPTHTMYRMTVSHLVTGAAVTRIFDCTSWENAHQTLSLSLYNLMGRNSTWRWTQGQHFQSSQK